MTTTMKVGKMSKYPVWDYETLNEKVTDDYRIKSFYVRRDPENDRLIYLCQLRTRESGDETFSISSKDIEKFLDQKGYDDITSGLQLGRIFGTGIVKFGTIPWEIDPLVPIGYTTIHEENYVNAIKYIDNEKKTTIRFVSAEDHHFFVTIKKDGEDKMSMTLTSDLLLSLLKRLGSDIKTMEDLLSREQYSFTSFEENVPVWNYSRLRDFLKDNTFYRLRAKRKDVKQKSFLCHTRTQSMETTDFWIKKTHLVQILKDMGHCEIEKALKNGLIFRGDFRHPEARSRFDPLVPQLGNSWDEEKYIEALHILNGTVYQSITIVKYAEMFSKNVTSSIRTSKTERLELKLSRALFIDLLKKLGHNVSNVNFRKDQEFTTRHYFRLEEESVPNFYKLIERLLTMPSSISHDDAEEFFNYIDITDNETASLIVKGLDAEKSDSELKDKVKAIISDDTLKRTEVINKAIDDAKKTESETKQEATVKPTDEAKKVDGETKQEATVKPTDEAKKTESETKQEATVKVIDVAKKTESKAKPDGFPYVKVALSGIEDMDNFSDRLLEIIKKALDDELEKQKEKKSKEPETWTLAKLESKAKDKRFKIAVGEIHYKFQGDMRECRLWLNHDEQYEFQMIESELRGFLRPRFCTRVIHKKVFVPGYYRGFDYDPETWYKPIIPENYDPLEDEYLRACDFFVKEGCSSIEIKYGWIFRNYGRDVFKKVVLQNRNNKIELKLSPERIQDVLKKIGHEGVSFHPRDHNVVFEARCPKC